MTAELQKKNPSPLLLALLFGAKSCTWPTCKFIRVKLYVYTHIYLYVSDISIKQMYFGTKCLRAELFAKRGKLWILIYCYIITFKHGVKSYITHGHGGENIITLRFNIL